MAVHAGKSILRGCETALASRALWFQNWLPGTPYKLGYKLGFRIGYPAKKENLI